MRPLNSPSKCAALRALLSDGQWHPQSQLLNCGGYRYGARIFELRRGADGDEPMAIDTECIHHDEGVYQFRMRPYAEGEARPSAPTHSRVRELEAEVSRLQTELNSLKRVLVPLPGGNLDLLLEARVATVQR